MFALKLSLLLAIVPFISAFSGRIHGGLDSDPANYLYHVAILKVNEDGSTQHVCGGAIIHRRYVLTGAHCVYDLQSKDVIVRAGGNVAPPTDKPHHERRVFKYVAKIMYPKEYIKDERFHEYDIAMLKIQGTFDLADEENFKKVQLPLRDNDYEDRWATVSGYGVHEPEQKLSGLAAQGDGFKSLRTKVISIAECQASRTFIITNGFLCTQSVQMKGHTCYGDGGNPLVFEDQVIGILNNPSTCDDSRPELYTRVSDYLDFIKNVLDGRYAANILYK